MVLSSAPTFFQGFSPEELGRLLAEFELRTFPAGTVILKEGECPSEMYVVQRGYGDLLVADRHGADHRVGQIGPGSTVGEMALFADQPTVVNAASATVRASTDLDVVAIDAPTFYRVAAAFPRLLHNVGAMLSQRLARSVPAIGGGATRHVHGPRRPRRASTPWVRAREQRGVAHPRSRRARHGDAAASGRSRGARDREPGGRDHGRHRERRARLTWARCRWARLVLAPPSGEFSAAAIEETVRVLCERFDHVLVQLADEGPPELEGRRVHLVDQADSATREGLCLRASASTPGSRPDRAGVLHVAALTAADEAALRAGMLAPRVRPAGRWGGLPATSPA